MHAFSIIQIIIIYCIKQICSQSTASSGNITSTITTQLQLTPYVDLSSPTYPNDYFTSILFTNNSILTLCTNNIIQIWNKTYPQLPPQNITDYSYSKNTSYKFISMTANSHLQWITIISYNSNLISYVVMNISNETSPVLIKTINHSISTSPTNTFICSHYIYSLFTNSSGNDFILAFDILSNLSTQYTIAVGKSDISVAPNCQKFVVWTNRTQIYFYSILNNFTLDYIFNQSLSSATKRTQNISFSKDSTLLSIQTDNANPIYIVSTTNHTITDTINIHSTISSILFADTINRFVLIQSSSNTYLYDRDSQILTSFDNKIKGMSSIDLDTSQIVVKNDNVVNLYDLAIKDGNVTIAEHVKSNLSSTLTPTLNESSAPSQNQSSTPSSNSSSTPSSNQSNSSSSNQSSPNQQNSTSVINSDEQYYLMLNFTDTFKEVSGTMETSMKMINLVVGNIVVVLFSSPFSCYFLGFFNFFNLRSLYVLLPIRLPQNVYQTLKSIYNNINTVLLSFMGFSYTPPQLTQQRVTDAKALLFQISSDAITTNFYNLVTIFISLVIMEIMLLISRSLKKSSLLFFIFNRSRYETISGLIISNTVSLILAFKFLFIGGYDSFGSKINAVVQILIVSMLVVFMFVHLLWLIKKNSFKSRQTLTKNRVNWLKIFGQWIFCLENIAFSMLVLIKNPLYFLVVVGISNSFQLYLSFHLKKWSIIHRAVYFNSLAFNFCFFIFYYFSNEAVLINTSILCLAFLLLASITSLLLLFASIINKIFNVIKTECLTKNGVQDQINLPTNKKSIMRASDLAAIRKCIFSDIREDNSINQRKHLAKNAISYFYNKSQPLNKIKKTQRDQLSFHSIQLKITFKETAMN